MGVTFEVTLGVQMGVGKWTSSDSSQWMGCRQPIVYLSVPVRLSMYPIHQQKCISLAGSFSYNTNNKITVCLRLPLRRYLEGA